MSSKQVNKKSAEKNTNAAANFKKKKERKIPEIWTQNLLVTSVSTFGLRTCWLINIVEWSDCTIIGSHSDFHAWRSRSERVHEPLDRVLRALPKQEYPSSVTGTIKSDHIHISNRQERLASLVSEKRQRHKVPVFAESNWPTLDNTRLYKSLREINVT